MSKRTRSVSISDDEDEEYNNNNGGNDLKTIEGINKYYSDLEKSGLASREYIDKEREIDIQKLSFNNLATLIGGG